MIEITLDLAEAIQILLLVLPPIVYYIILRFASLKNRVRNILADSPQLESFKVKIGIVYLGITLFLISFVIGEFYEVMFDLVLPVTQGGTERIRTVSSLVFQTPFTAGWIGSLPWYGFLPAPSSLGSYHDSWSWIFATTAYTDNPNFLGTIVTFLLTMSVIVGTLFLVPLAIKRIRQAFLPSIITFTIGMTVFTKSTIGGLGQAIALALGAQVQYGIRIVSGSLVPDLNEVLAIGFIIAVGMYALFLLIGQRLWKIQYNDRRSRIGFLLYITLIYWLGLVITVVVV